MKTKLIILIVLFISIYANAQQTLTLEDCYSLATKNYPLSKQTRLIQQKSSYEIEALSKGKLPKIDVNAQATYQSDVIGLPTSLPGVQSLNKDQYRATLDINQLVYNGGIIDANTKLKEAQTKTQQQLIEVSLYQIKTRISQYFFSILLLQEKKALLSSKKELLTSKVKEVKSGVKFGAILPSSELVLEAEIIKINQQLTEIKFENLNSVIDSQRTLLIEKLNDSNEKLIEDIKNYRNKLTHLNVKDDLNSEQMVNLYEILKNLIYLYIMDELQLQDDINYDKFKNEVNHFYKKYNALAETIKKCENK